MVFGNLTPRLFSPADKPTMSTRGLYYIHEGDPYLIERDSSLVLPTGGFVSDSTRDISDRYPVESYMYIHSGSKVTLVSTGEKDLVYVPRGGYKEFIGICNYCDLVSGDLHLFFTPLNNSLGEKRSKHSAWVMMCTKEKDVCIKCANIVYPRHAMTYTGSVSGNTPLKAFGPRIANYDKKYNEIRLRFKGYDDLKRSYYKRQLYNSLHSNDRISQRTNGVSEDTTFDAIDISVSVSYSGDSKQSDSNISYLCTLPRRNEDYLCLDALSPHLISVARFRPNSTKDYRTPRLTSVFPCASELISFMAQYNNPIYELLVPGSEFHMDALYNYLNSSGDDIFSRLKFKVVSSSDASAPAIRQASIDEPYNQYKLASMADLAQTLPANPKRLTYKVDDSRTLAIPVSCEIYNCYFCHRTSKSDGTGSCTASTCPYRGMLAVYKGKIGSSAISLAISEKVPSRLRPAAPERGMEVVTVWVGSRCDGGSKTSCCLNHVDIYATINNDGTDKYMNLCLVCARQYDVTSYMPTSKGQFSYSLTPKIWKETMDKVFRYSDQPMVFPVYRDPFSSARNFKFGKPLRVRAAIAASPEYVARCLAFIDKPDDDSADSKYSAYKNLGNKRTWTDSGFVYKIVPSEAMLRSKYVHIRNETPGSPGNDIMYVLTRVGKTQEYIMHPHCYEVMIKFVTDMGLGGDNDITDYIGIFDKAMCVYDKTTSRGIPMLKLSYGGDGDWREELKTAIPAVDDVQAIDDPLSDPRYDNYPASNDWLNYLQSGLPHSEDLVMGRCVGRSPVELRLEDDVRYKPLRDAPGYLTRDMTRTYMVPGKGSGSQGPLSVISPFLYYAFSLSAIPVPLGARCVSVKNPETQAAGFRVLPVSAAKRESATYFYGENIFLSSLYSNRDSVLAVLNVEGVPTKCSIFNVKRGPLWTSQVMLAGLYCGV